MAKTEDSPEIPAQPAAVSAGAASPASLSPQMQALEKYRRNHRVKYVRVVVNDDCCPSCRQMEGAYPKDSAPPLPVEACSHPLGCRCSFLPFLTDIYP